MNSKSSCCGGTSTTNNCSSIAELPRYYPRQLITPADLTLEQDYFRDRMRRHNRLLHGWGVVCGAMVCPVQIVDPVDSTVSFSPWQVQVQSGYILGPYGDDIILDCPRIVDVRTQGVSGVTGDPCIDTPDPWCTEVFTPPDTTNPTVVYIAVKYMQSMTRPVRVQPVGCGCDDTSCEYSRWHDGYEIGVLQKCPPCNHMNPQREPPNLALLTTRDTRACPDCACGPWVGLAAVTVNADGTIVQIDNCSCRRLVMSFSSFWWQCSATLSGLTVKDPAGKNPAGKPIPVNAGSNTATAIEVSGANLDVNATYTFGDNVVVNKTDLANWKRGEPVELTVKATDVAGGGNRSLIVVNPDCSTALVPNAINVVPSTTSRQKAAPATPKGGRTVIPRAAKKPAVPPQG
jgi:hypothetical protein